MIIEVDNKVTDRPSLNRTYLNEYYIYIYSIYLFSRLIWYYYMLVKPATWVVLLHL